MATTHEDTDVRRYSYQAPATEDNSSSVALWTMLTILALALLGYLAYLAYFDTGYTANAPVAAQTTATPSAATPAASPATNQ